MSDTKAKTNEKIPCTYPAEWFVANQGKKPRILILTPKDVSLGTLRHAVYQAIKTMGDFDLDLALSYFYQVTRNVKERLDCDWISYGIVIGENGTDVDPFSPLEVITAADTIKGMHTGSEGSEATVEDDKWMITFICLIYRLSRASYPKHKNKLQNHGLHILKTRGCRLSDINLENLPSQIFNWIKNENYKKTIASFDMFFNKFRRNEYAICRYGTIVSRYRDCAALLSYFSTCKTLGLTEPGDLLKWLFTDDLRANANTLFTHTNEEYVQYDSYFMYQVDLGLTQKSAYCATANQAIYFVTNLVSAILLNGRGLRAHKTLDDDFDIITHTLNA